MLLKFRSDALSADHRVHQPEILFHRNSLFSIPMRVSHLIFSCCLAISAVETPATAFADTEETAAGLQLFESKIRPVLVQHCYKCHSAAAGKSKGGLLLDSRQGLLTGGDSGPAILPGNADDSLLVTALAYDSFEMPPTGQLPQAVVEDFRSWINMGAPDPRTAAAPAPPGHTVDIAAGRKFWSFQPRRPPTNDRSIDSFINPQTPPAPPRVLLRRLYLDLIGLPPTLQQQQQFLDLCRTESLQTAVEATADELLANTAFGEKWARHWLDVVRYADSNGGDFNLTFHDAWRYRNYVIDAFNDDLPYDRFLLEQIAGDLLPWDTPEQRNRQLVATGFLMVAAKMLTERDKAKMHLDIADEQLDTIGQALMGLTLGCARCHDHKFDPIPTADYYAMAGILHSTRTADRVLMNNVNVTGWTDTELLPDAELQQQLDQHKTQLTSLQQTIAAKRQQAADAGYSLDENGNPTDAITVDNETASTTGPWRKSTYRKNLIGRDYLATDKDKSPCSITWKATVPHPGDYELRVTFGGGSGLATTASYVVVHTSGESTLQIDQTVKPSIDGVWHPLGKYHFSNTAEVRLTDQDAGGHVIADAIQLVPAGGQASTQDSPDHVALLAEQIRDLQQKLRELQDHVPQTAKAMAAMDNTDQRLGDLQIRIRGEADNKGALAPRGFLQVVSLPGPEPVQIPSGQSGRVQLAQWLTTNDHPLTARVLVNRLWQQLFGVGLVATSDNFGLRGSQPTHPELLDHLANRFVDGHWSIKTLIRDIIVSRTWQQSATNSAMNDPENLRFHRQNRRPAPAETIRDSILQIAGELDPGRHESPVSQLDMYAIQTSGSRHASLAETGKLRQRSIYLPIIRGAIPPSLEVFDFPNPDLVCGKRSVTTVPSQALFMMNSPFVQEMALAAASQAIDGTADAEQIFTLLYQQILVRKPEPQEIAVAAKYTAELVEAGKSQQQAIASFVQVLFSSTEFRFIE